MKYAKQRVKIFGTMGCKLDVTFENSRFFHVQKRIE